MVDSPATWSDGSGPATVPGTAAGDPFDVVVVGSANADLVVEVPHRPGPGETVLGGDLTVFPGGKGANQAVAAARLGARTAFVGRVGDDAHGRFLREALTGAGVEASGLRTTTAPTGTALILLTPDGENSIVVSPGANARLDAADVDRDEVRRSRVLLLQGEVDAGTSLAAARLATGLVVLNLAPVGPVPPPLLERCDVLVVNEYEAAALLGAPAPDGAARTARLLRGRGPSVVVITLGALGAVAVDGVRHRSVRPPPVDVVDTTGAGDAFTAALAQQLAAGVDPLGALELAVRAGAAAVTRRGAQPSFATMSEVVALPRAPHRR
ncbi:MAG: ribokinase [Kineosporiaceae bacterium]